MKTKIQIRKLFRLSSFRLKCDCKDGMDEFRCLHTFIDQNTKKLHPKYCPCTYQLELW